MKTCTACKEQKAEADFYSKGKENRMSSWCKSCFNKYCTARWTQIKMDTVAEHGGKCHDCLGTYHPAVFEFHHLDPSQKDYEWSKLRLFSKPRRDAELAKCVMLCANCHRLRHALSR